jgi:hypothetical protein
MSLIHFSGRKLKNPIYGWALSIKLDIFETRSVNLSAPNASFTRGGFLPSLFQVKAPVTRRPPHRPVLEDFPHTVPRFQPF